MAVAFAAISSTTYASRTNTTVPAAALGAIANDDLLLLLVLTGAGTASPDVTPPTGFTICPGTWPTSVEGGGFNVRYWAYFKIANNESGDYTVTHAAASSQAAILRFTGAKTVTPINPAASTNTGGGTTSTALSVTTAVTDVMIVWNGHSWGDTTNDLTPPTGTTPTFTERMDTTLMYVATGVVAAAGATGNKAMTNNNTGSSPWAASLIAIEPATGGAAQTVTGGVTTTHATVHGATPVPGAVAVTAGVAGLNATVSGATPVPQPVTISGGAVRVDATPAGATPASVTSVSGGAATVHATGHGATPTPGAATVSGGSTRVDATGHGATPAPVLALTVTAGLVTVNATPIGGDPLPGAGFVAPTYDVVSPWFTPGATVDLVALTSANEAAWAHERLVRRSGRPNRFVAVRPQQAPFASSVASADGYAAFARVPAGRYWLVGELDGVVRRVARTVP